MTSLARAALHGVAWNWAGSAALVVAQIASTMATARLVSPDEFGAYAAAQALVGFASYFTLAPVGSGLLRRSALTRHTIGTALVLTIGAAVLVAGGVWLAAQAWAAAWHVPHAVPVIRVLAIVALLTAASTVPVALLRHRLRFGSAATIETGTQVLGLAVGVALAVQLRSALALALGQLAASSALLLTSVASSRRDLTLAFARTEARELLTFAGQVSLLNLSMYVGNTAPSWFAARVYGSAMLGIYSRAYLIVSLPLWYFSSGVMKVLYPLYGRVREDPGRTRTLIDEALVLSTGLSWPLFGLVAGAAPVVVDVLLGPQWHRAGLLVMLCAVGAAASLPCGLLTNAAEALGWMRLILARQGVFFLGLGVSSSVALAGSLRLEWLLAGIAFTQWIAYLATLTPFVKRHLLHARSLVVTQAVHALASIMIFALAIVTRNIAAQLSPIVEALCILMLGLASCVVLLGSWRWFPATHVLVRRVAAVTPRRLSLGALRGALAR